MVYFLLKNRRESNGFQRTEKGECQMGHLSLFPAQFKAACAEQGTTTNAVLQQAVRAYLDEHPAPEQPHAAGKAQDDETEARRAALLESIKGL